MHLLGTQEKEVQWNGRGHFFAAAAEAMRRILVDSARRKESQKRGGEFQRVQLDPDLISGQDKNEKLLAMDEALAKLEETDAAKAQLVKLRFFAGLTMKQIAEAMDISTTTADRYWAYARAWLQREMAEASSLD